MSLVWLKWIKRRRRAHITYTQKVRALSPIAYWPIAESSGTAMTDESGNSRNGAYTAVTLGVTGIGDGRTAGSFDGSLSYANAYSAGFVGAFSGNEGSLSLWAKVSGSGVWTDGVFRQTIRLLVDGSNYIFIDRAGSNTNGIRFARTGGGTVKTYINTSLAGTLGWFNVGMTWSVSGNALKFYINGAQVGSTKTTIGTFSGTLPNSTTVVGSQSSSFPATIWSGSLAHVAIFSAPLSGAQMTSLATI